MIAADEIKRALDRILASETFARSDRGRKLLGYLVAREQAGEGERLKGFSIAMDVFGKDADFDPSTDAVVRVQAGRLRELLGQYYLTEGIHERVGIDIARGGYLPSYRLRADPEGGRRELFDEPAADSSAALDAASISAALGKHFGEIKPVTPVLKASAGGRSQVAAPDLVPVQHAILRHVRLFWVALAVISSMLGFVAWRIGLQAADTQIASAEMTSAVKGHRGAATRELLPTVYLDSKDGGDPFAMKAAGAIHRALPRFDTISYAAGQKMPASNAGQAGAAQFVLRVTPAPNEVLIELENLGTARVLFSRSIKAEDTLPLDDALAALLTVMLPSSGVIYAYLDENGIQSSVTGCMILENAYYNDQKAENHGPAYRCFEELVNRYAKSPMVWAEIAALELEAVTDKYPYPADATLDRALRFARRGIELGPNSALSFRSNGYVLLRAGARDEGIRWTSQAVELNPYDLTLAASAGYNLVFAGEFEKGGALLARSIRATAVHPQWWDFALFAGLFATGADEEAYRAADALAGSTRTLYLAARLLAAQGRGQTEEARTFAETIRSKSPKFADDPMASFVKSKYPPELAKRLAAELAKAGLGPQS